MTDHFSYQKRMKAAHENGHLFAHMFENYVRLNDANESLEELKSLFDVMDGKAGSVYESEYRHQFPATEHGILGLPTTAMKKEYPVRLYSYNSPVGLLMDSAKPVLVNSGDSMSNVNGRLIQFRLTNCHMPMCDVQRIPTQGSLNLRGNITDRFAMAAKALTMLWAHIARTGWDHYADPMTQSINPGMNEVNVAANLNDVCGIIIDKHPMVETSYAKSVQDAEAIRNYLSTHYEAFAKTPLPIFTYEHPHLKGAAPPTAMEELTQEKIDQILGRRPGVIMDNRRRENPTTVSGPSV